MMQLVFPETEQDWSQWLSPGGQERLCVADAPCVVTQTFAPGHLLILVGSDFFPIILSAVRAFFVKAHCLPAYRVFWGVHTPVLPLMSAALRFEMHWVFLDRPLVCVSQTTSCSALPPPGRDGDLGFKFGAQALLPPELAGGPCTEGADSPQTASDVLRRPDAIPRRSSWSHIGPRSIKT